MKKLGKLTFSKKLSKEEQKQLLGGYSAPATQYACHCRCVGSVGEWDWYSSDGKCPSPEKSNASCSSGYAECWE